MTLALTCVVSWMMTWKTANEIDTCRCKYVLAIQENGAIGIYPLEKAKQMRVVLTWVAEFDLPIKELIYEYEVDEDGQ